MDQKHADESYARNGLIGGHFLVLRKQMVDSRLATTRVFWRKKYYAATDKEASDPRPWCQVLAERKA